MHPSKFSYRTILATSVALCALSAAPAIAAPVSITTPHIDTTAGATSVTFGGQTFVNQGLQGMGRITAGTKDFNGDTFGAFSGMDIKLSTWTRNANGSYSGSLFALPDRGPNGVGGVSTSGSNYPARYSSFSITFTPYTDAAALPVTTSSQNQVQFTQTGGLLFKDFNGAVTTGFDPGTGAGSLVTQNGIVLPGMTSGPAAGKITMDSEGLRFLRDGSFYVSDEYGANVYYFDATGKMQGVVKPPPALIPLDATGVSYSSLVNPITGRRPNQGLEGVTITPDGKRLVTLLQSATIQDSTSAAQTRTNTRLMVYDITQSKTPTNPIADYVFQLPIYTTTGNGTAPNASAAQSEILALNGTQFLVLSRDGNGLGVANLNPVFKSILLIDTAGATNIVGTPYEQSTTPISPNGTLTTSITPVQQVELVNILNSTQLGKFGENLNNITPTRLTLGEKWEGMALVPVLDPAKPQDFFLFVGNDNDFLTASCNVGGSTACATTTDSDAHILVYRLTLPTYVDAEYLASMLQTSPVALEMMGQDALSLAGMNTGNILSQLDAQRRSGANSKHLNAWVSGTYRRDNIDNFGAIGTKGSHDGFQGTVGLDYALSPNFVAGLAVGYGSQDASTKTGFSLDGSAYSIGGYLHYTGDGPHVAVGLSVGHVDLDKITRPAAYGLTATANAYGSFVSAFVEGGYTFDVGTVKAGPVVGYASDHVNIQGYTEMGAAGGNIAVPNHTIDSQIVKVGGEAYTPWGAVMPFGHLTYNWQLEKDARTVSLALATAQSAMGAATVSVPTTNHNFVDVGAGLQGYAGPALWSVGYSAQIASGDRTNHIVRVGVGVAF